LVEIAVGMGKSEEEISSALGAEWALSATNESRLDRMPSMTHL
jgi:hypothetical protein